MSSKSVNKVILVGNLGKDPDVKYTASGIPVARFSLATTERFKDDSGKFQERTEWHSIVAWQKLAEIIGEFCLRARRSMSKENFKAPAGKTAKAEKRNTGRRLWPRIWCFWVRERKEMESSRLVQIRPRNRSQHI